ncbi:fungal-specific transcription factor domain-containing protein [Gongronella butleri]|nr:fungal-specific transcription factor domain-containing protein [Gongronella butleri]
MSQGIACVYQPVTKKRGPPKGYIEAIEGRLHRLEALISSVAQEDDPRFSAIISELSAPLQTANGEMIRPRKAIVPDSENSNAAPPPMMPTATSSSTTMARGDENDDSMAAVAAANAAASLMPANSSNSSNHSGDMDTNENAGNISVDESGQLRYYGKSSGYYMLRDSRTFKNGAFHFKTRDNEGMNLEQAMVDPFELPPQDLADHLLSLYFAHFYTFLPIVHKDTFMNDYQGRGTHPPSRLLLNAMFAVAARVSPDPRVLANPDDPKTAGDHYFERARILLEFEYDDFKTSTVQALLLMSSHQNGALKSIRGWIYSGMAFRMVQNLGLHCNCDSWDLTHEQKEERKRVFWSCFVVDRLSSAMHGRSPIIDERDCDVPYPRDNDACDRQQPVQIMDTFLPMIHLAEILGNVLREVYTVRGRNLLKRLPSPDGLIGRLDKSLNSWMAKLRSPARYRPPNTRIGEMAKTPSLAVCQIHMMFYTTLILLHRPFIPGTKQQGSGKSHASAFPSKEICNYAADKLLDITVSMMNDGKINHINNYTLYFMFTAGIIFIHEAASKDPEVSFDAKISINKILRAMETVEITWITSTRHSSILGELAGLRDIDLVVGERPNPANAKLASIAVPNSPTLIKPEYQSTSSPLSSTRTLPLPPMQQQQQQQHPQQLQQQHPPPPNVHQANVIDYHQYYDDQQSSASSMSPRQENTLNSPSPSTSAANAFDLNGTAYYGVPASFDLGEWDYYLKMTQQQQQ